MANFFTSITENLKKAYNKSYDFIANQYKSWKVAEYVWAVFILATLTTVPRMLLQYHSNRELSWLVFGYKNGETQSATPQGQSHQ